MTRVAYLVGKILEVAAMLTVGVALFVYGFGEDNMDSELAWLLLGGLVFIAGYVLERRSAGER